MTEKKQKTIQVRTTPQLNFKYAAGKYGSLFLKGLQEQKIYASKLLWASKRYYLLWY